jgi:hypothetical protein
MRVVAGGVEHALDVTVGLFLTQLSRRPFEFNPHLRLSSRPAESAGRDHEGNHLQLDPVRVHDGAPARPFPSRR